MWSRIASRKLKKDRDKSWAEGRQYLKDGQKAAAQRCLQACRASEMLMSKLEMKRWVFEQLLSKLELAKSDQDFSQALGAINTVVKIDPEAVADVLGEVQDKLGEQVDTDKIWEKVYGKEMEGVETQMTDVIPSIEDMEKQLQDEVAADVGHARGQSRPPKKARAVLASSSRSARAASVSRTCWRGTNELHRRQEEGARDRRRESPRREGLSPRRSSTPRRRPSSAWPSPSRAKARSRSAMSRMRSS